MSATQNETEPVVLPSASSSSAALPAALPGGRSAGGDPPAATLEQLVDFDAARPAAQAASPVLAYGFVEPGVELSVRVDGHHRPARRAKSCLVAPEAGDRVLCAVDGVEVYVLSVLDGAPDVRVVTTGKLDVRAGDLSLGGDRVDVRGAEVTIGAESLKLRARSALAAMDDLRLLGRSLEANVTDKVVLLAERVETRASRILQRTKQLFRFVDDAEQARVGHYDLRAEGLAAVRAENTIVSARVLAKLDGEQVKIG